MARKHDAKAETYEDVRLLLCAVTNEIARRYNLSEELRREMESEARLIYSKAYETFDHSRGLSFPKYVQFKVSRRLLDWLATVWKRENPIVRADLYADDDGAEFTELQFGHCAPDEFMTIMRDELTPDGMELANLALNPPKGIRTIIRRDGMEFADKAAQAALVEYLTDVGWSAGRVMDAFRELGEFIKDPPRTPHHHRAPNQHRIALRA